MKNKLKKFKVNFEDPNPIYKYKTVEAYTRRDAVVKARALMEEDGDGEWLYCGSNEVVE